MPRNTKNSRSYTPAYNAKRIPSVPAVVPAPLSVPVQLTPKALRQEIQRRKKIRDAILGHPKAKELGGLIAEFHQRNAYSDEAMAGRIIAMYVEFILGIFTQILDGFVKSKMLTQREAQEGLCLVYQPDQNGNFPPIYDLDDNGDPDPAKALAGPVNNEWLIWKNGYFPKPTLSTAFSMCLADFSAKVLGRQVLDGLSAQRLFGEQSKPKSKKGLPNPSVIRQAPTS